MEMVVLQAAELITSYLFPKVRACDNPECLWLFIDRSKNQRRRWYERETVRKPDKISADSKQSGRRAFDASICEVSC